MHAQKLMLIMAHPDDAEFCAGGFMTLWREAGHLIKILCLTNGNAGHQTLTPQALQKRRQEEAQKAAHMLDAELEIWPVDDGRLEPSVAHREALIGAIRDYQPQIIITHRTADYHPDHRAAAQLVKDSAYLLQVPSIAPEHAPLAQLPGILLAYDGFDEPRPFRFDWVIDTATVQDRVIDLLDCHASQVYEWLPSLAGVKVSPGDKTWLRNFYQPKPRRIAYTSAAKDSHGRTLEYAEAFEVSRYGGKLSETLKKRFGA